MDFSPNTVKIDLSNLVFNLNQVKGLIDPGTRIMGIVKSDGYGHGLLEVARILEKNGVQSLGVAHLHEALRLREHGIRLPVVILCGVRSRQDMEEVVDKDLIPVVYDLQSTELLSEEALRKGKRVNIHLKIDTGMNRLGIPYGEAGPFIKRIMGYSGLHIEGLMSHLSSADEEDHGFTKEQINYFQNAVNGGRALGLDLPLNNLANSAGIMAHRDSHFEMVRPGIMLYGGLPSPEFHSPIPLRPVMGFSGEVLQVKDLPDQTPVSYGRRYYTEGPKKVAIVSAGYGDGLPRSLSNEGKVLIAGKKADILGTVCMNMVICDVTGIHGVETGDEAVLLGAQGEEVITGDDMAGWSGSISYEIFLSIGQRSIREYI